jgi:hypothetical protein
MGYQIRDLDFVVHLMPFAMARELGPNDAKSARRIEEELADLEIVKYRLPFPVPPPSPEE